MLTTRYALAYLVCTIAVCLVLVASATARPVSLSHVRTAPAYLVYVDVDHVATP